LNHELTEYVRRKYDRYALVYDLMEFPMEKLTLGKWREQIWRMAKGRILEVGVGTGKNIPHHPRGCPVVGVDFSRKMLERAVRRAQQTRSPVELLWADVQELPFPDNSFDTVVATCVFCSVPDPVRGFQELRRVCKDDGKLLFLEHMRSERPIVGKLMDALNPLIRGLVGVNINRRTLENIRAAGLVIEQVTDLQSDIVRLIVARPGKG